MFTPLPAVMLVDPPPEWEPRIVEALPGIRILRVGHVSAACERVPTTWPLAIVVTEGQYAPDAARLADVASGVGAELVVAAAGEAVDALVPRIAVAVFAAEERRSRKL